MSSSMNVAKFYFPLLKRLKKACDTRPHYVQELRFMLSLPLLTDSLDIHAATPSCTQAKNGGRTTASPSTSRDLLETHLSRPASEMLLVDRQTLFALCKADLRGSLEPPMREVSAKAKQEKIALSPADLRAQVAAWQQLNWLQRYLSRVLSETTTEALSEGLAVSAGRLENEDVDFIPDAFFDEMGSEGDAAASTALKASLDLAEQKREEKKTSRVPRDKEGEGSVGHAPDASKPTSTSREGGDREDSAACVSAGAIGLHREVVSSSSTLDTFPFAVRFLLAGCTTAASKEQLLLASQSHKTLGEFVMKTVPSSVVARNEDVEVRVEVEPHEVPPRSSGSPHVFVHSARFRLSALNARKHVQLVNTFFVRLRPDEKSVLVEAGVMPAGAVKQLLQERDWSQEERQKLREEKRDCRAKQAASPTTTAFGSRTADGVSEGESGVSAGNEDNTMEFRLFFPATTHDSFQCLKGLLFYKVGGGEELLHEPIKVISLRPLLLSPGNP